MAVDEETEEEVVAEEVEESVVEEAGEVCLSQQTDQSFERRTHRESESENEVMVHIDTPSQLSPEKSQKSTRRKRKKRPTRKRDTPRNANQNWHQKPLSRENGERVEPPNRKNHPYEHHHQKTEAVKCR